MTQPVERPIEPVVHPIEQESFALLADRVDLSGWPPTARQVAARVVHATGDPELARTLVAPEPAAIAGVAALAAGAPVLCDVEMVRAAVNSAFSPVCRLSGAVAGPGGLPTRSAVAMRRAATEHPDGAVVVVGCAPTALEAVCDLIESGALRPALVIGTPVGFVGAAASKVRLRAIAAASGVAVITNVGERGGSAVAAAVVNALGRIAGTPAHAALPDPGPALFVIGHGTRSAEGIGQFRSFVAAVAAARPDTTVGSGLIELAEPGLDDGIDALVARAGAGHPVIAVPLVLLGAGHLKDDGPVALTRARARHPGTAFAYGHDLGVHPLVLDVVEDRLKAAGGAEADAAVVIGRGSTDPDANADLAKVARLLADHRGVGVAGDPSRALGLVEPAFVSLAAPGLVAALDRCAALGARRITVGPYFLFTGVLPERLRAQTDEWALAHPGMHVEVAEPLGVDGRLVELAWRRYDEARQGDAVMNCDGCMHRSPLPGYEDRVGAPPLAR